MTMLRFPIWIFLCAALAGVLTAGISYASQLEGIDWRLVEVGGAPVAPLAGQKQPSLMLDAAQKKVTGFTGCNSFFGSYTLEGSSLKFSPLGMTRKACPDLETGLETAFLEALERTRGWKFKDGALLLTTGDEVLARFETGTGDSAAAEPGSMTYRSKRYPSGAITLSQGEYRAPAAPGSESGLVVRLTDGKAFGRVRGREAGAVVLVTTAGGTGSFYDLALLFKAAGKWENTDTILLGDRVKVHSVVIEGDHIVVHMTTHGPNDPLCCPTLEVTKRFAVQDDHLVPLAEGKTGGDPQIIGTVWQWAEALYNNDTPAVPAKPENYTVRFLENGNIDVKADCNRKGGTYSVDGKKTIDKDHSFHHGGMRAGVAERHVRAGPYGQRDRIRAA